MSEHRDDIWENVRGIDTDGLSIFNDLQRLVKGLLDSDESSELLSDLVRDNQASTAGYAAIPLLLSQHHQMSPKTRLEAAHSACLIIGLAGHPPSPPVPPDLVQNMTDQVKQKALCQLFDAASKSDMGKDDIICLAAAALLLVGRRNDFFHLVENL